MDKLQKALAWGRAQGRRFTDQDVLSNEWLAEAALDYLEAYTGNFEFLLDMRSSFDRWGNFTPAQVRGILNCALAEANRTQVQVQSPTAIVPKVPNGTYTVVQGQTYATLRLTDCTYQDCPRGTQVASFLSGADNEADYMGFAFVKGDSFQVWARYKDNCTRPRAALEVLLRADDSLQYGEAYALQSGRCFRCGRKLTVPASLHRGMGPECAVKAGVR